MTILYQNNAFYVCRATLRSPKAKGYEVYEDVGTHARRVAVIGYEGDKGLNRAIQECDTREAVRWARNSASM